MNNNDYLEYRKKVLEQRIERGQQNAKSDIKIIKRDFFDSLPEAVVEVLRSMSCRWKRYDWFEEAWDKYRDHVLDATSKNLPIKAPGYIFNEYIDEQIKEDFLKADELEDRADCECCDRPLAYSDKDLDELFHHGIKGQKWGVRRYQNPDGSLTESGKARYNSDMSPKDPTKMSNEELQKANQRLGAESTYRNLTGTSQPGRALTRDNAIKIGATFLGTAALPVLYKAMKGNLSGMTSEQKGQLVVASLIAGGIGALMAGTSALGGEAKNVGVLKDKDNN